MSSSLWFISISESYLTFPNFRVPVNDKDECTVPIRFLPFIPSPLPPLDFNFYGTTKIPVTAGTACPVITRGMSKAFLQAPLPPSDSSSDSQLADPVVHSGQSSTNDSVNLSSSTLPPSKPTSSTPDGRPNLPVHFKQFSSAPKSLRLTTQQLHQYLGCRSLKNWKLLDEFAQPTVTVSEVCEKAVELGDVVNL